MNVSGRVESAGFGDKGLVCSNSCKTFAGREHTSGVLSHRMKNTRAEVESCEDRRSFRFVPALPSVVGNLENRGVSRWILYCSEEIGAGRFFKLWEKPPGKDPCFRATDESSPNRVS